MTFSSIGIVKESSGSTVLWIGPAVASQSIAHLDPTTRNDQGLAVDSFWESGLARGKAEFVSRMIRVGNLDVWIRGNGTLITTVCSPDKTISLSPPLMNTSGVLATLSPNPGTFYQEKFDLSKVDNWNVRFETNAVDAWWELSQFTGYSKADLFNR